MAADLWEWVWVREHYTDTASQQWLKWTEAPLKHYFCSERKCRDCDKAGLILGIICSHYNQTLTLDHDWSGFGLSWTWYRLCKKKVSSGQDISYFTRNSQISSLFHIIHSHFRFYTKVLGQVLPKWCVKNKKQEILLPWEREQNVSVLAAYVSAFCPTHLCGPNKWTLILFCVLCCTKFTLVQLFFGIKRKLRPKQQIKVRH